MQQTTDLFGIPVPSTDRFFLVTVAVHILISFVAVLSGAAAMLITKTNPRHRYFGRIYYWSMAGSFITVIMLSIMRWPHNIHLLIIGVSAFASVYVGRRIVRSSNVKAWVRIHTIMMGSSYILLLTGFYVDNGKNLPLWRELPQFAFWVLPAIVGIPVIIKTLKTHPLNKI